MPSAPRVDAHIVGSGPNGLAAGITLARTGRSVLVLEARETIGGGARTEELTLPGFRHDVCSAVHPFGVASPFFANARLADRGLEWVFPPAPLAHPLDDGTAVLLERSLEATGESLGEDSGAYRRLMGPLVSHWQELLDDLLGPFPFPPHHPSLLARFGLRAIWPARTLAMAAFQGERARALFAGLAAHSIQPLERPLTSAFGLVLGALAHARGWPFARGGSGEIAKAMASMLRSLGGEILTGERVERLEALPAAGAVLLDLTPRQIAGIAGGRLPAGYRQRLEGYRYGPGVFKADFALDGPIPWTARECERAGTLHLGGTLDEIAAAERAVWNGGHPERPFVLLAQQSLFDPTRAPAGRHTAWAYCHVPNGSTMDMSARIEAQIERFAPGFRDRVLARSLRFPMDLERSNANCVGGDIAGGVQDLRQLFTRPVARRVPYTTPVDGLYICSSSTPPGGGVHGMCGYHAARALLQGTGK